MIAARIARDTRTVLLGLLLWPFVMLYVSPRLTVRAYRTTRRLVRKAIKRPRLWLNAWQYQQSEDEAAFFASQRQMLIEAERRERFKQVRLQQQRNKIAGW